jgi:hypothetical protein
MEPYDSNWRADHMGQEKKNKRIKNKCAIPRRSSQQHH